MMLITEWLFDELYTGQVAHTGFAASAALLLMQPRVKHFFSFSKCIIEAKNSNHVINHNFVNISTQHTYKNMEILTTTSDSERFSYWALRLYLFKMTDGKWKRQIECGIKSESTKRRLLHKHHGGDHSIKLKYNGICAWEYFRSNSHAFISLSVWWNTKQHGQWQRNAIVSLSHFSTLLPAWRHRLSFTPDFVSPSIGFISKVSNCNVCCITSSHTHTHIRRKYIAIFPSMH